MGQFWGRSLWNGKRRKENIKWKGNEYCIFFFICESFLMFHSWRLICREVFYFPLLSFRSPVSNCNRNSDFIVAALKSSILSHYFPVPLTSYPGKFRTDDEPAAASRRCFKDSTPASWEIFRLLSSVFLDGRFFVCGLFFLSLCEGECFFFLLFKMEKMHSIFLISVNDGENIYFPLKTIKKHSFSLLTMGKHYFQLTIEKKISFFLLTMENNIFIPSLTVENNHIFN